METTRSHCTVCGVETPNRKAGSPCPRCLLGLAFTPGVGAPSTISMGIGVGGPMVAAERFLRQGVLPVFGDYELEAEIARGGMGVVYRARQRSLNRVVAVKMIVAGQLATPESIRRFRLEAEATARLHHPGIVPIYEIGESETQHYFSMALIDGASLAECRDELCLRPGIPAAERRQQELCIAELIAGVGRALDFAHQRGVLHRDVKPSNILIDGQGQPRLTDFGLAKLVGREAGGMTMTAAVLGTPGYLAPEQVAGRDDEVTTAADVYGLGATLYELLAGRPPFVGSTAMATMMMAVDRPPALPRQVNPAVHRDLETIAMRCLEKAPERRYRSAAAVADELDRFRRGEPIQARPVGRAEHLWRWCRRNPVLAAACAALVLAVAGGAGAVSWQWRRAEHANVELTETVADLKWRAIDDMLNQGQSSRALASIATLIRDNPADANAATFAMSVLEQRRFPVPAAAQIRHPGGAELSVSRLSPDGTRIVTASYDGTARLWDAKTSQESAPPLVHGAPVTWAEFGPDGTVVATCSDDRTARLWDAATGRPKGEPIRMAEAGVAVHFSADGGQLLVRTQTTVTVLAAADGQVVKGPLRHAGRVVSARFLSGGAHLFTAQAGGAGPTLQVWNVRGAAEPVGLAAGALKDADYSEASGRVAVVGPDGRAWVADFPSGKNRRAIADVGGEIQQVTFSPKGDRVAMVGRNHWARVYDAATGAPITDELPHYYLLEGAAFAREGKHLLTWADDALAQVWDVDANRAYCEPMRHANRVMYAETSAREDGTILTTASHLKARTAETRTGAAQLWTVLDRQNPSDRSFGQQFGGFDGCRLSPDGRWLAIASIPDSDGLGKVRVLDVRTGAHVCSPIAVGGSAWGVFFTPDASRLVTTTSRGQVAVWSMPEGKPAAEPVQISTTIQPAEMSADGRLVATGSTDGVVRLWDSATGRVVREVRHGAEIHSVCFSPDGRLLASAAGDRTARVWETATGRPVHVLSGHQNEVMTVLFSPDGRRLVTGSMDFTARVWDAATGRSTAVLRHRGDVLDVAFSPDGRLVATASRDRTAVVWDAATGAPHSRSLPHEQGVRSVRFSPDGRRLWTLDFRALRAWDATTSHPLTAPLPQPMIGGTAFQGSTNRFQFLSDGGAVLVAYDSLESRIWNVSEPPAGAPAWFPDFLEAVAGERFVAGPYQPEPVPPDRYLELARQLRESVDTDFYTRWGRQWLAGAKPPTDLTIRPK